MARPVRFLTTGLAGCTDAAASGAGAGIGADTNASSSIGPGRLIASVGRKTGGRRNTGAGAPIAMSSTVIAMDSATALVALIMPGTGTCGSLGGRIASVTFTGVARGANAVRAFSSQRSACIVVRTRASTSRLRSVAVALPGRNAGVPDDLHSHDEPQRHQLRAHTSSGRLEPSPPSAPVRLDPRPRHRSDARSHLRHMHPRRQQARVLELRRGRRRELLDTAQHAFRPFGQLLDALARLRQVHRQTVELVPFALDGLGGVRESTCSSASVIAGRHRGLARKARERVRRVLPRPHVFFRRRLPESDALTVVERHRQNHARL